LRKLGSEWEGVREHVGRDRKRKLPGSMHERLLHPTSGRTTALGTRGGLHSWAMGTVKEVQRSDCLCGLGIAGGFPTLSHLWAFRAGQAVAPSAFRSHHGVVLARVPFRIEGKLYFSTSHFQIPFLVSQI
jgi:hypothetical protein